MTENKCRYSGDREQAIVSYLYSDDGGFSAEERDAFDAHLATCDRCRTELIAFESVRMSLAEWSPPVLRPEAAMRFSMPGATGFASPESPAASRQSWWRDAPAWAQMAAAVLCLGVGAGVANVRVHYDATGLQVSTGWMGGSSARAANDAPAAPAAQPVAAPVGDNAPWRAEFAALEARLRADLPAATAGAVTVTNNEALRRARALVDDSERRQQRELALRLAEAVREASAQRQADLMRIDRNIGAMQNNTGREMLRQRNEMLNYVTVRTASQRPQ